MNKKIILTISILILLGTIVKVVAYISNQNYRGYKVSSTVTLGIQNSAGPTSTSFLNINEFNLCKRVTSTYANGIFVPTKTSAERAGFIANKPSNTTIAECGCRTDADCNVGKICQGYVAPVGTCVGTQTNAGSCSTKTTGGSCSDEDTPTCAVFSSYATCQDTTICGSAMKILTCKRNGTSCGGITSSTTCSSTAGCSWNTTTSEVIGTCITPPAVCGNGVIEGSEVCDGSASCSVGGVAGTKYCNVDCTAYGTCYPGTVCKSTSVGDADSCAGCYGSWTMSNCVNRECSTHGIDDATWNCSYGGTTKSCTSRLDDECPDGTCFTSGTKVRVIDGSQKNIEDIQIGEQIFGQNNQINTVIAYDRPMLGTRKLYSINDGPYFVTHEHPFMTLQGWKSISPEATRREMPDFEILPLKVGDVLVRENGEFEYIWSIQSTIADPETPLYNFILDGNNTYYADGYLVHNKLDDGASCTTDYACACGFCEGGICCPTGGGGGCFISGTKIILGDGTIKSIEQIQTGDILLGVDNNQNKVTRLIKLWKNRELYSINGSDYFVTDTHPFMTTEGWKSFNPEGTLIENPDMIVSELGIGDILVTESGLERIDTIGINYKSTYVYNFKITGNHTYYANGYLVHNPAGDAK